MAAAMTQRKSALTMVDILMAQAMASTTVMTAVIRTIVNPVLIWKSPRHNTRGFFYPLNRGKKQVKGIIFNNCFTF
jgi:hypothetical protein